MIKFRISYSDKRSPFSKSINLFIFTDVFENKRNVHCHENHKFTYCIDFIFHIQTSIRVVDFDVITNAILLLSYFNHSFLMLANLVK